MSPLTELIGSAKAYGWGSFSSRTSFESIATVSLSTESPTITFSNIPNTFKHLQIRGIAQTTEQGQFTRYRFNADAGSNYRSRVIYAAATTPVQSYYGGSFPTGIIVYSNNTGNTNNFFSPCIIDILDYANTNKYTTTRSFDMRENNSVGVIAVMSGLWLNTDAITSITFSGYSGNFPANTHFALYGMKAD